VQAPIVPAPTVRARTEAVPPVPSGVQAPGVDAESVVAAVATRGLGSVRRFLPPPRRRPALYLAAALVAATTFGTVTAEGPRAVAATPTGHSVSVAHELGIDRESARVTPADAQHLQLVAASRNRRGAEEVAAARTQAAANERAVEAARPKAVLPVNGARLTSPFGMRWGVLHAGIDLAAPLGTPEYAAMDGVVLRAGPASGFGLAVYIQHANGDVTVYGHMEKILVTEGQVVRAGQTIALLGANGQATGPHLHFEVHIGGMLGAKVDPIPWLRARGVTI
jgi:murein DD-endopeptidase MepM/ murein hydrolase activator NlpD